MMAPTTMMHSLLQRLRTTTFRRQLSVLVTVGVLALALPAQAAKVPCPADAPAGSACYLVVKAPQAQCKGKAKTGKRCTRTVGVDKRTGLCAQHKGQVTK